MSYFGGETALALVALAGWFGWLYHKARRQQTELKRDRLRMSSKALEKFGTAGEFLDFVQSREGQAIFNDLEPSKQNRSKFKIRMVQIGVLLVFMGAGSLIGASRFKGNMNPDVKDIAVVLSLLGTVAISMGIGFFVTAFVTYLWKRWSGGSQNNRT
jgi:hypothetical protein